MVEQTPTSLVLRLILALLGVIIVALSSIFILPPISLCTMLIGIAFVAASLTAK
jgi:uncharacterized membrane protein YccC